MRGRYVPSLNFKYYCLGILGKAMALSVFNPSLSHLSPFHLVLFQTHVACRNFTQTGPHCLWHIG